MDGGFYTPTGFVGGYVWQDENGDGIQSGAETGIPGATVTLLDAVGNAITTATTDGTGHYLFPNLPAGDYALHMDASTNTSGLTGLTISPQNQGSDDALDSDIDPSTGQTAVFSFDPTLGDLENMDGGFYVATNEISGFVWNDYNDDGIQDPGEPGLGGITILLLDANTGAQIAMTLSDASGGYGFSGVGAGMYVIEFDPSTNSDGFTDLQFSPQDQGNDDSKDSDADPDSGQTDPFNFDPTNGGLSNIGAGFYQPLGTLTGFAWHDLNENGIFENGEPGIEGVSVVLFDNAGFALNMTVTDANGFYFFDSLALNQYMVTFFPITNTAGIPDFTGTIKDAGNDDTVDSDADPDTGETDIFIFDPLVGLPDLNGGFIIPQASIGGTVWDDQNMDGIRDQFEPGLSGVTIHLIADNGIPVATTTSDASGQYTFDGISQGDYYLDFDLTTAGAGFVFTLQDQGNDENLDSDANPANGETVVFHFDPTGGSDHTWGAGGFLPFGNVGDFVFHDCNGNGIQDAGESGISGVEVQLIQNNQVVDTRTTGTSGAYLFANVPAGTYSVRFILPAGMGFQFSPVNQGNDLMDSDADPNTGETAPFVVTGSADVFDVDAGMFGDEAPYFVNPPQDEHLPCNDPQFGDPPTVIALDDDDDHVDITFTEEIVSNGGNCSGGLTVIRTWTATDDCGNSTTHTQTISSNDEFPPVILGIPDITVDCDSLPTTDGVKALDDCDQDVDLTYTDSLVVTGTCEQLILRKWIATDDCGNMTMNFQKITTIDTNHPKITLTHPLLTDLQWGGSLTLECENSVTFTVDDANVMDTCDPDPNLMLMVNTDAGDCEADGFLEKITYVWLAEDACGNTSTVAVVVYVVDETPPEVQNPPADLTVDCGAVPPPADPGFTDQCDAALDIVFEENIVGDTCSDYQIIRTWRASDDCGNTVEVNQTIEVQVDPTILLNVPDDLTVECDAVPDPPVVTAQSDCFDVNVDFSEAVISGDCTSKILRTWTATDACGHVQSAVQTITTMDTTPPEIELTHPALAGVMDGDTLVFECDSLINFNDNDAVATDACADSVAVSFMEMPVTGTCADDGYLVFLQCCWKAEDDCGNQSDFCIFVKIVDNKPPVLSGVPDDLTIDLSAGETIPPAPVVTAADGCDLNISVTFMENQVPGPDNCGFVLTRTWRAMDECGNEVIENQVITAIDQCDCADDLILGFSVQNAQCGASDGGITLDLNGNPDQYVLTLNPNAGVPLSDGFAQLPYGVYELTATNPDFTDCSEKIAFEIVQTGCLDTMSVIIDQALEVCLDS
ncbi:MAG: hypothetical protein D6714_06995, partial [Bacteroidetes bacterium]